MKRFLSLLLICALIGAMIPCSYAAEGKEGATRIKEEDYISADLMWDAVYAKEAELRNKKVSLSKTVDILITEVTSSPYYAEDSLIRNGDHFFWETIDGIPCGYSPRLAEIGRNAVPTVGYDIAVTEQTLTTSYATKGGSPGRRDVFLIQPYYGIDQNFTDQYVTEAENIAAATGGTATVYRTTDATIDQVAHGIESGAVVIFDSHGDTDYINPNDTQDCVSRANTSYICLQVGTGLTSEDYAVATGDYGEYYHAFYGGSYGSMRYYCVDGTAIANHMDSPAPNNMLWMAICLGMATDGMHAPLRSKGVEVAYGYSQSVTFDYDYLWEEAFWSQMQSGKMVAEAIDYMKDTVGEWDWCHASDYDTIEEARATYSAFPVVVSSEDVYPGHGNVDDLQAVNSTWTLSAPCSHETVTSVPEVPATCTEEGNIAYYLCVECYAMFRDEALTERITASAIVIPPKGHTYESRITTEQTCTSDGVITYTCRSCGDSYTELIPAEGHTYVDGYCSLCGKEKPLVTEFAVGVSGTFVLAAKVNGKYYAMSNDYTDKSGKLPGIELLGDQPFVEEEFASDIALELTYIPESGKYTIHNGGYYLRYTSSTNVGGIESPYYWTISEGVNGTWQVTSSTSSRGLIYRTSGFNYFGGYYRPNVTAGGREYFDLEILPVCPDVPEGAPGDAPAIDDRIVINHTLNLASDISINYAVRATLLEEYDSFTLRCEIPVYEGNTCVDSKTVMIEPILNGYFYYFTLDGLTAVQMGDEIEATLHMTKGDGSYYSETDIYSIATYAKGQLGKTDAPSPLKKLCAELLRYGSMAQEFKQYRTDSLPCHDLTEEQVALYTDLDTVTFNQNNQILDDLSDPAVTWIGKTLNLESKVIMRFVADFTNFEGDPKDLTLHVNYKNYLGEDTAIVLKEPQLYIEGTQCYAFDLDSLLAAELRCVVNAAVYHGDTRVSATVQYSPDAYAVGKTGTLLMLCKALMAYSDAAFLYFTQD